METPEKRGTPAQGINTQGGEGVINEPVVHREVLVCEWDFLKHLIEARGGNK